MIYFSRREKSCFLFEIGSLVCRMCGLSLNCSYFYIIVKNTFCISMKIHFFPLIVSELQKHRQLFLFKENILQSSDDFQVRNGGKESNLLCVSSS